MALQVTVEYHNKALTFEFEQQEIEVYHLHLKEDQGTEEYIPKRIVIQKKGKIWVSDAENCRELSALLTEELTRSNRNTM